MASGVAKYVVNPGDYSVKSYIQEGAMGKVFAAVRISDGKKVAMKFFGYTIRRPTFSEMEKEIQLLMSLKGIDGIVQLEGVFLDTADGMLPGKRHKGEFPVIVMEMIEGGELFDRINNRATVSERDLAVVFRHTIDAIQSLHEMKFIHRDLKLENLMLVSTEDDSKIKLIDFGMMVRVLPPHDTYTSSHLQGTAGYYAPESILHQEYSFKTDIWQAGCILYCMLSGLPPFNPRYPKQITHYTYIPMTGEGWDNVSGLAKDLVARILNKNKNERLTCEQILNHPWMQGAAPEMSLGSDYFTRIKHLVLRQKFKTFFLENNITEENKARRNDIELMLPFLREPSLVSEADDEAAVAAKKLRAEAHALQRAKFREKLILLRTFMIQALLAQKTDAASAPYAEVETTPSGMPSLHLRFDNTTSAKIDGQVDFPTFLNVLEKADLMELGSPAMFNIFDIGKTRTIDLKEFLTTMLAFRPEAEDADAARLYFNIFDIRDTGYIDKEELRVCLELLLLDDSSRAQVGGSVLPSVDEIFKTIDFTRTGKIDFNEFKTFYEVVLTATTNTRSVHPGDDVHSIHPAAVPTLASVQESNEEETEAMVQADEGKAAWCCSCDII